MRFFATLLFSSALALSIKRDAIHQGIATLDALTINEHIDSTAAQVLADRLSSESPQLENNLDKQLENPFKSDHEYSASRAEDDVRRAFTELTLASTSFSYEFRSFPDYPVYDLNKWNTQMTRVINALNDSTQTIILNRPIHSVIVRVQLERESSLYVYDTIATLYLHLLPLKDKMVSAGIPSDIVYGSLVLLDTYMTLYNRILADALRVPEGDLSKYFRAMKDASTQVLAEYGGEPGL